LLLLFVGSGCSALVYEVVWFQLLQLVIGSSAVSLGVLLGTFMGGMCVGSVALPRIISARRHPLRVYAVLEFGIGAIGIALLFGMPYIGRLYTENVGHGLVGILLRGAVCAICLLPPTVLMGATLPAIARWIETTPQGVSWLGYFYGANIAGAVFGCLLAGFYLLRVYDVATATCVAATINGAVALIGLALATFAKYHVPIGDSPRAAHAPDAWTAYVTIALSGLCALGAEVVWTRQLSLMLGATVYTFSIILAVFLVGLGIGSSVGAFLSRGTVRPSIALGWCQVLLTAAIAWCACMLAKSLPFWPIDPTLATSAWFSFQLDLMRTIWTILPAACLWGASFPLALAAVSSRDQDPGRLVGGVYAANTVGAIVGAIGFSMLMIGWLGTQTSQQVLIGLSAAAALLMFGPLVYRAWQARSNSRLVDHTPKDTDSAPSETEIPSRENDSPRTLRTVLACPVTLWGAILLVALASLAAGLVLAVPETPRGLIAYGRHLPTWGDQPDYLYVAEGMHASISVSEWSTGVRNFHVAGKVVASSESQDMRLQRMLGHLPALIHARPRSVLVVGCGAGVTAGSFVLYPDVERIVICEIEPLIPPAADKYFGRENYHVLDDPRVELVCDDARHYIVTTDEKFDIITSDPIHPWVKGAAALYSEEYFEICKRHLKPGGVVTQWVPLYETNLDAVKSEMATFFHVFTNGTIWANDISGEGYDMVLIGQNGEMRIDVDELQQRLDNDDHAKVHESLQQVKLGWAISLMGTYAGRGSDLAPWLKGAEINRDGNLRLQYLAGMGSNLDQAGVIYDSLMAYRKYPENLFVAAGNRGRALKALLEKPPSGE